MSENIKKYNLQKWYYYTYISIIEQVMADLLISRFYNTDFWGLIFEAIFNAWF